MTIEYVAYFMADYTGDHVVVREMTARDYGRFILFGKAKTPDGALEQLIEKCIAKKIELLAEANKYNNLVKMAESYLHKGAET